MDYLKTAVPSQFIAERGANLVVINPGSANVRIGLAHQQVPFNIPHCIARYMSGWDQSQKMTVQDQMLNLEVTRKQQVEREKAYDSISSLLKIPFLDEERASNSISGKMGRVDGYYASNKTSDAALSWTSVVENFPSSFLSENKTGTSSGAGNDAPDFSKDGHTKEPPSHECEVPTTGKNKFRNTVFGEEAMKISPKDPYCVRQPIRRGHFNVSQHYPPQQVIEDIYAIWDWILNEKLHIYEADRVMFSVILVVPETFDSREIKEMLSIVLRDLRFGSAVVHQEALAAVFGNGLSTACIVNLGAQVTSVMCIEDGVALPMTGMTLPFGGEDVSKSLLWVQQYHRTWPAVSTDPLAKPIDLLMLNKLKELYCQIREGEFDALAVVHSYEHGKPPASHKTRLLALNVPPMGLFFPQLLVPDECPPPPRSWFHDYEDMTEDTWHLDFQRRPEMADVLYSNISGGANMFESYAVFPTRHKGEDNLGLAEAITKSILSTGRIDLQRKLFCSIQLIGGVGLTGGLVPVVEERVLHAIPANEAIDTVEVLQSRTDPTFVCWKGGAILGILDFGWDMWIHREDWIQNGIHVGAGRKYKESHYLQAQAMCYINS